MGSGLIKVEDIVLEKAVELLFMQDQEVIQAFSSHASQKAFAVSGKQRDDQAATGECGPVAALLF